MQVANVCSYKLKYLKNEFQFLCELGWFLQGQSHIINLVIVCKVIPVVLELVKLGTIQ